MVTDVCAPNKEARIRSQNGPIDFAVWMATGILNVDFMRRRHGEELIVLGFSSPSGRGAVTGKSSLRVNGNVPIYSRRNGDPEHGTQSGQGGDCERLGNIMIVS